MKLSSIARGILTVALLSFLNPVAAQIITTYAGNNTYGFSGDGGPATNASVSPNVGLVADNAGNLYSSDNSANRIRKIDASGIITTFAGNGTGGYTGDGMAATLASLNNPQGLCVDAAGNIYVADANNQRVRKITTSGIIVTVAGNGTGAFSGDGGPATAASLNHPSGVYVDAAGNMLIADANNHRIRKVDAVGIISTIAGTGTGAAGVDGIAATASNLFCPLDCLSDPLGNVYICDYLNNRIRMVNTAGIISTIAGNGSGTFGGDGMPATASSLYNPMGIDMDAVGNLYIADYANARVRKVATDGYISTVVGNGTSGYSGDGGPATAASLSTAWDVAVAQNMDLYVSDANNWVIRKVGLPPNHSSDSFYVYTNNICGGISFDICSRHYTAGQHVKTLFSNGTMLDTITAAYGLLGRARFTRSFASSGSYTIKHILFNGSTAVDSISYTYSFSLCQALAVNFYLDLPGTCNFDAATPVNYVPVVVEVDSNGIAVDTLSTTGGIYYLAHGVAGDVYSFKVIDHSPQLLLTCPSSGIIMDTLFTGINHPKAMGFQCSSTAGFELAVYKTSITGRHLQKNNFIVNALTCSPIHGMFNWSFSPKYDHLESSSPSVASVSGSNVVWDLGMIDLTSTRLFSADVAVTTGISSWITPGDTVTTHCVISPTTGDIDTTNNIIFVADTVKSSFDPNIMQVVPSGYITAGTQLRYTVVFENTGNDTARNIYVMDTLSDYLVPGSMRIVATSHAMTVTRIYDNAHHCIFKFDFPSINLPDSSHHNQCDGMVIFDILTRPGLADGTVIPNHAEIFFDDNPAVITDTTSNIIGHPGLGVNGYAVDHTISLFPNPASTELSLLNSKPGSSYTILDMYGMQLITGLTTCNKETIDVHSLPLGNYVLQLTGKDGYRQVLKFTKL